MVCTDEGRPFQYRIMSNRSKYRSNPKSIYRRKIMYKFPKSIFAFLALAALAVPAHSVTIDTEQTFDTSPAWGENVFITETGKVTLGQDVLIGQTANITIDIATGGSLTSNNTKTGNHDANNS